MTVASNGGNGYTLEDHKRVVASVSERVKQLHAKGTRFRIYHGSTNSTRPSLRDRDRMVDTSSLRHVVSVDVAARTALVEPNVAMDALVEATLPHGLLPPVVMEFPGITAGGAFAGVGGESSSFKHGYFDACVASIEVVLGDGRVVTASETENADLLMGSAGTMGTLGVVTLLEVSLRPAEPYVELTYHTVFSPAEAVAKILEQTREDAGNDFVDGIMYSATSGAVCAGRLVKTVPTGRKPTRLLRARDQWFYLHCKSRLRPHPLAPPNTDFIPVRDYLFRYDRGAFWMARHGFRYFSFVPFDRVSRAALDPLMHTREMYRAMHESGHYDRYLIQDVGVPCDRAAELIEYVARGEGIWPLWLCPLKPGRATKWLRGGEGRFDVVDDGSPIKTKHNGTANGVDGAKLPAEKEPRRLIFNVGVWGPAPSLRRSDVVAANRALERRVAELGGLKWPYSQYFYTEDEFWGVYDRQQYEALREKYGAQQLPTMYDKVRPPDEADAELRQRGPPGGSRGVHGWLLRRMWDVWPVSGLYGVAKVVMGRESRYLVSRKGK